MVKSYLGEFGFCVTAAHSGGAGISLYRRERFDALILDLMLPDMDGLEVCRQIRADGRARILMLTARGDAMDRVVGLEMGADDYLAKPFEPRELLARLRSILRRAKDDHRSEVLLFGRLEIDAAAREVRLGGEPCALTRYQFALLLGLARHSRRGVARGARMGIVKERRFAGFERAVYVHIS